MYLDEIDKIQYLCNNLVEYGLFEKAKSFNKLLLKNENTYKNALINIIKISNLGYSDDEIIEACCFLLRNEGFKKEYYEALKTRITLMSINKDVIEALLVILEAHQLDYKIFQYCIDYYKDNNMLENVANLYILEGKARLDLSYNSPSFSSFIDALKVSKYNNSVISEIVNAVIENKKSFQFFKYLIERYQNNKKLYDIIERLVFLVSKNIVDESWDKEYVLGEILMYIEDEEQQKDLESYLTTTPNK